MSVATMIDVGGGPILCFGGPYSNLEATQAMRAEAERRQIPPQRVICTGDIVAYCANPNETARAIRDWGCHVIQGNCEVQLAARADSCGCGFGDGTTCDLLSRGWYPYANSLLDDDLRAWMGALPGRLSFEIGGRRVVVIHGGGREISRFLFEDTPSVDKAAELDDLQADIVIAGHCGIPFLERHDNRLWVNAGVIGMPANDGTPDGWYALIEQASGAGGEATVSLHRLGYDAAGAADALNRAGCAPHYAGTLVSGLWPSLDVLPQSQRARTGAALAEREIRLA